MDEFLFWWKKCFLQAYTKFDGRARRKEFWMFAAVNAVASIVASIIDSIIFDYLRPVSMLYSLAILVPGLAVSCRRMHDIGKSGKVLFLALIPFVGAIILIIWATKEGDKDDNQYGPDPKANEEFVAENN